MWFERGRQGFRSGERTSPTGAHGDLGLWAWDGELNGTEGVRPGYLRSLQLASLRQQSKHSPAVLKSRAVSLFLLTAESCLLTGVLDLLHLEPPTVDSSFSHSSSC
jgi:hypothetical protein